MKLVLSGKQFNEKKNDSRKSFCLVLKHVLKHSQPGLTLQKVQQVLGKQRTSYARYGNATQSKSGKNMNKTL